jgi:hypothetical protein
MTLVIGLIVTLLSLAIPVAVIVGIVRLVRRSGQQQDVLEGPRTRQGEPVTVERVVIYVLAFAGLMAVLVALAILAALAFYPFWPDATTILSPEDAKTSVSSSIAALLVGAPVWLSFWAVAQRRANRSAAERETVERRLFLGAVFAVTALVVLFGVSGTVTAVFMLLAGAGSRTAQLRDLMAAATRTLVYSVAWWYYARIWWREHDRRVLDWTHDLAVYVVAGISATLLLVGLTDAGREIVNEVQSTTGTTLFDQPTLELWHTWSTEVGEILAGGAMVAAALRYDFLRGRARILRVIWLYTMLLWIVPVTIITAAIMVAETLRRLFGYVEADASNTWAFLADALPLAVVGGCFWIALWLLVRREAHLEGAPEHAGIIRYPRRVAIGVLDVIGLGMASFGLVAGLWVAIDALLTTHDAVAGGGWWWEVTSWSLAVGGLGAVIWLPSWAVLQRAAGRSPAYEGTRWERRWLLTGATLAATLVVIGFTVALLYQILRGILGPTDANTLSDALRFLTAAVVAAAVALYHGLLLRREMPSRAAPSRTVTVQISALITPDAAPTLQELRRWSGCAVAIAGYVTAAEVEPAVPPAELAARLAVLGAGNAPSSALLLLRADGGRVIPYAHDAPPWPYRNGEATVTKGTPASAEAVSAEAT